MILDKISQIQKYKAVSPNFETAVNFIEGINERKMDNGRIDLENGVYVVISEYNTVHREEKKWEVHRKYIDLQYIFEGSEIMGYQNIDKMKNSYGYDEMKDAEFFDYQGVYSGLIVEAGMFAIFFPEDAHAPCIFHKDLAVKKVLVKIPV